MKKKYVIGRKNAKRNETSLCDHFPGATKKLQSSSAGEQIILQELAHILEDLPQDIEQESVLSHVRSYDIVRQTFLSSVRLCTHEIKIDRELLSYEDKKQFNSILALVLEYLTDSNQQLFSKKEFQSRFDFQHEGYKLYTAMITTLQRHDVQQCLSKQFDEKSKVGLHNLGSALEGVKLFLRKKAGFVREEISRLALWYQDEISQALVA